MSAFYQEGAYQCEVVEYGFTEAKTGTPQFVLQFKVIATEDNEAVERSFTRTFYRALTEKTMQYFIEDIKNLGWSDVTKPMSQLDPNESQFIDYRGATVLMYVKEEPDQKGGSREKWGVSMPGGPKALEIKKLDGAKKRSLDNLFAAELRNQGGSAKAAKPEPAKAGTQSAGRSYQQATEPPPFNSMGITDDDVPF